MRKIISIILMSQLIMLGLAPSVGATGINRGDTGASIKFEKGLPETEDDRKMIARDPENPALPFPADQVYRTSPSTKFGTVTIDGREYWGQLEFDYEVEDIFAGAKDDQPKLYSWRQYLIDPKDDESGYNKDWHQKTGLPEAGLIYVPTVWSFGIASLDGSQLTLEGTGRRAFYTDRISHLQMWDNREVDQGSGWKVRAQMVDWPTTKDGSKLVGSYISIPKAVARNEFNANPSQEDKRFKTNAVNIDASNTVTLWETKSESELKSEGFSESAIFSRGKGMSTLTWNTEDVRLHIPNSDNIKAGNYQIAISWSLERGPES